MLHLKSDSQLNTRRLTEENIFISFQALANICKKGCSHCTYFSRITIPRQVEVNLSTKLY